MIKRLFLPFVFTVCTLNCGAQTVMRITLNDGTVKNIPANNVSSIDFKPLAAPQLDGLEGQWLLIASANGTTGEGGIATAITDTIAFTATPSADGTALQCHADAFIKRASHPYPADFTLIAEQEEGSERRRIGMALTAEKPASTEEFAEAPSAYAEDGLFYWGSGSEAHHYIYFLTENIATQRLEPLTLWSGWQQPSQTTFTLPQNQQLYAVVAAAIPCSQTVGYAEIWASLRLVKQ